MHENTHILAAIHKPDPDARERLRLAVEKPSKKRIGFLDVMHEDTPALRARLGGFSRLTKRRNRS